MILLATLVLVSGALAFNCEHLVEPERTACLDRAADANVGMFPVPDHAYKTRTAENAAFDPYAEGEEGTDDIMGDLGESAHNTATMSAQARARAELKNAEATSQGMFNEDIMVARAFSGLSDEMDSLRTHVGELHAQTVVADTEHNAASTFITGVVQNGEHNDLGESDEADAVEPLGVLDASVDDITKDLTPHISHKAAAPASDQTVDDLLKSMDSTLQTHKAQGTTHNPLDAAPNFIQVEESNPDVRGMDDLVQQDFAATGASLMGRAQLEASQFDQMNQDNYEEMTADADDLGDAESMGEQQGADLDVISKTLVEHPDLDAESVGEKEASMVVNMDESKNLGEVEQGNEVNQAVSFASDEDKKEEAIIERAQAREQRNEDTARDHMYKDLENMNKLNDAVNADVGPASKPSEAK